MNWQEYFFNIAKEAAKKSKDPSTKVGCIITGPDNDIRSVGFNGFPRNVEDREALVPERYARPAKYLYTVHAEANAITSAAKCGTPLDGCTLYIGWWPCAKCAGLIIQAGIKRVVIDGDSKEFNDKALYERWKDDFAVTRVMFDEAGINVHIHREPK